jgi:hypothetical protein
MENFIKNASAKEKLIGHNKYQLQIKDLQLNIERLENELNIKNNEIDLFKENLTSLQLQNKELNINILKLESDESNKEVKNTMKIEQSILPQDNSNSTLLEENISAKFQTIISELQYNYDILSQKYTDLKQKYQFSLNTIEDNIFNINTLNTLIKTTDNKLKLYEELCITKDNEINTLKQAILKLNNDISELKTIIFEKDSHLKQIVRNNHLRPINNVGIKSFAKINNTTVLQEELPINEQSSSVNIKEEKNLSLRENKIVNIEHKQAVKIYNNNSLQKQKKGI